MAAAKNFISEDDIEQALLQRLQHLCGFDALNCFTAQPDDLSDGSGRTDKREVILADRLRAALERLNPQAPAHAVDQALAQLVQPRTAMSLVAANREMDTLIRDGVPVTYKPEAGPQAGQSVTERLKVIAFDEPDPRAGRNHYLAVSQLWVRGEHGYRRPDVLLYVNGLPLVFIELKNSNVKLRAAFDDNLTTYKAEIPQLFTANALCLLSNGIETRLGSLAAQWEHFFTWLRVDDEKEKLDRPAIAAQGLSVERVVLGLLKPERLLDYVENFCVFYRETQKVIAQNHQFIGVNNAFAQFQRRRELGGKLGVFWHTQGSGKSFSMVFYTRKIFRKLTGNFTFVVVTDRDDLDGQIYRNFLHTGVVAPKDDVRPKGSAQLREMLGKNKRVVFTLIQKFRYDKGKDYPLLSDRDDIVVIVDEAHRTQYAGLAENMRAGLPHANFLAFTGTPLLGHERKTNAWFGDYVSEYNFQQSVEDGATVPLFYEKRVPEVLIQNDDLSEEFAEILEDENLDEPAQAKLEKRFAQEMAVIKVDDRLETIARDIVFHFPRRGYLGKGIVISVDKFTAVTMYDKVQSLWKAEIKALNGRITATQNDVERQRLKQLKAWMSAAQMAVIVSEEAGEEEKFAKKNLDIKPHRQRMNALDANGHDIEFNFKDPEHPLQLVFVCAMWLTGFDAPTVSTLYLDKPMQGHTLMQTIARANRVTGHEIHGVAKRHGEIVDYYNVFRRMKKALRDYAAGPDDEELPVQDKSQLFALLDEAIEQGFAFCHTQGVALQEALDGGDVFTKLGRFNGFADTLLASEEQRKSFNVYENTISSLYEACKPEVLGQGKSQVVSAFQFLRGVMDAIVEQADIDNAVQRLEALMDASVVVDKAEVLAAKEFETQFKIVQRGKAWDLSKVNVEKLREEFQRAPYKNIEIADLQAFLQRKLAEMLAQNSTRGDFVQRLQKVIDTYNSGATATENYYEELTAFAQSLKEEAERAIREGLTEDELEIFDLLKKDALTQDETQRVKLAAKHLLQRLVAEQPKVLVQGWHMNAQTQKQVRAEIERVLDQDLPETYDRTAFKQKCDNVYDLMVEYAIRGRKWAA
ncbi:type I restriction endonuclease subunit R [Ideonella dechloratans]|uniref:Type I restriction enzyme endonuclease subunit n=1 Tax=Ideonella dechloratans TaxID=36863 RepID=A0A643F7F9_IDEDE|nr:type I restriction endonuclease subunit R [Ideonella dechloratans]KAB0576289.1 type I restriction endonuclease subunit R [Ideonella dechloratans]UFU10147.1 type I restriction endonuclease subunit R [Ideonella dechloratans]